MGQKGSQTTTTTQAPPAWANQYYQQLSQQAVNLGNQAYTPYTGQLTAPINAQQQTAIGNVNDLYPQVSGMISGAAEPLTQAQISQYYNPFQQNVINATEAQFANTNAQQFNQADANAVMAGAYGGTGNVRAKAMLAGQQQLAEAPVIAGLEQQGYTQALGAAGQQFQQNPEQAAGLLASTGTNIANTQFGYGTAEQQTQQNALNAAYQQWLQQQAYPFQANAYAAGVVGGVGSLSGGTGTVTAPPPNPITQIAGVGATAAGAYMASDRRLKEDVHKVGETNDGQPIYRFRYKGSPQWHIGLMAQDVEKKHPEAVGEVGGYKMVDIKEATDEAVKRRIGGLVPGFAGGGAPGNMPYAGAPTYVPAEALPHGSGPPHPVSAPVDTSSNQIFQNAAKMAGSYKSTPSVTAGNTYGSDSAFGTDALSPIGWSPAIGGASGGRVMRYGGLVLPTRNRIEFNRGGPIRAGLGFSSFVPRRGYQGGGSPATFDERFQGEAPPPDLIGGTIQGLEAAPITTQPVPPDGGTIMQPGLEPPAVVSPPASAPQAAPVQTAGVGQEEMPAIVAEGPRGVPSREDPRGLGSYIRQAAAKRGIDPDFAVFAAGTEGLRQFKSDIPGENSYGAFQLNTQGGLGNEFYKATRLDPSDPKNERATIDFALDHAAQHGWGAFHGVRNAGYGPWEGIGQPSSALALTNEEPTGGLGRRGADGSTTPPSPRGRTDGLATGQETPSGGGFGFGSHPDFGQALMAAGLGMMASRSPFLGVGIGEGGLAGLGAYGSLQRQHLAEQQLDRQNRLEADALRHQQATEAETSRYHSYEMNKPQVIAHVKDKYNVDHPIMGIPQVNKAGNITGWMTPSGEQITNDMLQGTKPLPASATPSLPAPAEPAPPTPAGTKAEPTMPSSPVQVASIAPVHIPEGMKVAGQPVTPDMVSAPISKPKQYNEKAIADLDDEDKAAVQAMVRYDLLPNQLSARSAAHADTLRSRALMYDPRDAATGYPGYQPAMAAAINRGKYDWLNGPHADMARKFSVAIDHVDLLKGIIANLDNQHSVTWSRLKNAWSEEFGGTPPTNFDAASRLIANEIVGATVGTKNALGDRDEIATNFSRNKLKEQQLGVIDTYEGLMAGQLHNMERQYKNITQADDFKEKLLSPRAREVFYGRGQKVENASGASAPEKTEGSAPVRKKQNGYIYEQQPDGGWKSIGKADGG